MRPTRYSFDKHVSLTVFRSGEKHELWGRAADISQGGMAATLSGTVGVGETASIRMDVKGKTLNIRAVVRHSQGHFCGLQFLAVDAEQRELIKLACEQLRPIPAAKAPDVNRK
jgi:c-di-GMP-binding flagellar brake protein YcgR